MSFMDDVDDLMDARKEKPTSCPDCAAKDKQIEELEDALVEVLRENFPAVTVNSGVFRTCFNGEIKALRLLENRGVFEITGETDLGIQGRFLPRRETKKGAKG